MLFCPKNIAIAFLLNSSLLVPYAGPKLWTACCCCCWTICSCVCGAKLLFRVWFWWWFMNGVYVPIFWGICPLLIDEELKTNFDCCCCGCCCCYCRLWFEVSWICELLATELISLEGGREKLPEIMAERFSLPDVLVKKGLFRFFIWLSSFFAFLSSSFVPWYYLLDKFIGEL